MSEFRIFCIGFFIGGIILGIFTKPDVPPADLITAMLCVGLFHGALAVACFGRGGATQ